jgi:P-type Ca2+ transporter type 2C
VAALHLEVAARAPESNAEVDPGAAAALLVALLTVPWLRDAFGFGPMGPTDWLAALAAGFIGVAWFEFYKARARR